MALIECSKCGKMVSDTTDVCIHCGASIGANEEIKVAKTPEKEEKAISKKDYKNFNDELKIKYEKEFLEENPNAKKYRRRGLEYKKLISLGETSAILGFLLIMAYRYLLNKHFDGVVYKENYAVIASAAAIFMIAFGILLVACAFIAKVIYNRTLKSYVYLKMFSRWLDEKHQVEYQPDFVTNNEKAIYEQIDLNSMRL